MFVVFEAASTRNGLDGVNDDHPVMQCQDFLEADVEVQASSLM